MIDCILLNNDGSIEDTVKVKQLPGAHDIEFNGRLYRGWDGQIYKMAAQKFIFHEIVKGQKFPILEVLSCSYPIARR